MGPFLVVNTVLIGAFGFAAIYHFVLWSQSRRDATLLAFAIHCALCSIFSANLVTILTVQAVPAAQRALELRGDLALLLQITSVWVLALVAGVRARWFVWSVTAAFLVAIVVNAAVVPLTGTVTAIERVVTSWGEDISVLRRASPSPWLVSIYALSLSINAFGLFCAARLWRNDRIGGMLLVISNTAGVAVALWAWRIDTAGAPQPYLGAIHYPVWVLLVAMLIARDYRARAERLAAADTERRQAQQELEQSRDQLQRLADGLLVAREEERAAIAREVHDVLGQALTALKMDTGWLRSRVGVATPELHAKLLAMTSLIDDAIVTVRRIASDLRPGVLDDLGLEAAIEWQSEEFQDRTGIRCTFTSRVGTAPIDPLVSTAVFRILQESLTNVARHSGASRVAVTLERRGPDLYLEVHDNGVGIAAVHASNAQSIGLAGMRERAQLVGGLFSVSGTAGAGTTVRVQIPLREEMLA